MLLKSTVFCRGLPAKMRTRARRLFHNMQKNGGKMEMGLQIRCVLHSHVVSGFADVARRIAAKTTKSPFYTMFWEAGIKNHGFLFDFEGQPL